MTDDTEGLAPDFLPARPPDKPLTPTGSEAAEDEATPVDAEADRYLRAQAIVDAINANNPYPLAPIPKDYVFRKRQAGVAAIAMHAAFELNGGVPRLVEFARTHPKEFYAMWGRLIAAEEAKGVSTATQIIFQSAVPKNPLDDVTIDELGRVVTADVRSADFKDDEGE